MDYSFNVEVAKRYGVSEAVFLHNLHFWIMHNKANGRHYFEDKELPGVWRNWTFNSASALTDLFPFWSEDQIRRLVKKLRDNGLIHIGNYNKLGMDRTNWYALSDEILEIYHHAESHDHPAESHDGNGETAGALPDSKPYSKHIYKDIVEYLNLKTNKNFKYTTKSTREHIHARLEEGFTLEDFKAVIDNKSSEWNDDSRMNEYLRPSTLFGTKFESYLNVAPKQESRWKDLD